MSVFATQIINENIILMKIIPKSGPRGFTCLQPHTPFQHNPLTVPFSHCFTHFTVLVLIPVLPGFVNDFPYGIVSNASLKARKIRTTTLPLSSNKLLQKCRNQGFCLDKNLRKKKVLYWRE